MNRLHPETLAQLTTGFATAVKSEARTRIEPTTIQLLYIALAELGERRRLDTALVGVIDAAKGVVDRALEEHEVSSAFEQAMARLELALLEFDELRPPAPPQPADPGAQRLARTPEG